MKFYIQGTKTGNLSIKIFRCFRLQNNRFPNIVPGTLLLKINKRYTQLHYKHAGLYSRVLPLGVV